MRVKIYSLLAAFGILLGSLALTAGTASASVTGHRPQPVQTRQFNPRPEPIRFFGCTRADRRLEFWLLLHQRHLNRGQRAELRFLERLCDNEFFFTSLRQ